MIAMLPRWTRSHSLKHVARILNALFIALSFVAILIGQRLDIAEQLARDAAFRAGLGHLDIQVSTLHPGRLVAHDIELPSREWSLRRLDLSLSPGWRWEDWPQSLSMDGLDLRIELGKGEDASALKGLGGGALSDGAGDGDIVAPAAVPLPSISLSNARIRLKRRQQQALVRFDGHIQRDADGPLRAALRGSAETSAGTLQISAAATRLPESPRLHVEAHGPLDLGALPVPASGTIRSSSGTVDIRLDVNARLPGLGELRAVNDLAAATATATATLKGRQIQLAPLLGGLSGDMELRADLRQDSLVIGMAAPLRLTVDRVNRDALTELGLAPTLANVLSESTRLSVSPWSPAGEIVELTHKDDKWSVDGRGTGSLEVGENGRIRLETMMSGAFDPGNGDVELTSDSLRAEATEIALEQGHMKSGSFDGGLTYRDDTLTADGLFNVEMERLTTTRGTVETAKLRAPIRLVYDGTETELQLSESGRVELLGAPDLGPLSFASSVTAKLPSGQMTYRRQGLLGRLTLEPEPLEMEIQTAPALNVELASGPITVRLDGRGPEVTPKLRLQITDAAARIRERNLTLSGIALNLQTGAEDGPFGTVTIGRIRHNGDPAYAAPLRAEAVLRQAAGQLTAAGTVRILDQGVTIALAGRHDIASNEGLLRFGPTSITFRPDGLQPSQISPRLDFLSQVEGKLGIESTVRWRSGRLQTPTKLNLEELGFTAPQGEVRKLSGRVTLQNLWPPETRTDQELMADQVRLGLPLKDARVRFGLDADREGAPLLQIERAEGRLAGGGIFVRDARLRPTASRNSLTVRVSGLSLARLFEQLDLEGVRGEGQLSGAIPLTLKGGRVVIDNGQLAAETAGLLNIRLKKAGESLKDRAQAVRLMLKALENFHYETLALTVNRNAREGASIRVRISGKNPEVLDGYPFKFNIRLTGDLEPILAALQKGRRLTTEMLQRALEADKDVK